MLFSKSLTKYTVVKCYILEYLDSKDQINPNQALKNTNQLRTCNSVILQNTSNNFYICIAFIKFTGGHIRHWQRRTQQSKAGLGYSFLSAIQKGIKKITTAKDLNPVPETFLIKKIQLYKKEYSGITLTFIFKSRANRGHPTHYS